MNSILIAGITAFLAIRYLTAPVLSLLFTLFPDPAWLDPAEMYE